MTFPQCRRRRHVFDAGVNHVWGLPPTTAADFQSSPRASAGGENFFPDKSAVFVQQQLIFHSSLTFSPRATAAYFFAWFTLALT